MKMFSLPIPRRSCLRMLAGSLLALLGCDCLLPRLASAADTPVLIRQLVSADLSRGRSVMWQTDRLPQKARVLVQGGGLAKELEFIPGYTCLPAGAVHPYVFHAKLEGLEPGRQYSYRISCDAAESDWLPLRTPRKDASFSALLFADNQSTDGYDGFRRLLLQTLQRHPHTSLLLLMGDQVDNGAEDWYWNQFFAAWDGVAEQLPLAPVIGNHECYNRAWQPCLPEDYLARLVTPANGSKGGWAGHYYAYDCGCAHFAVLDTQEEEEHSFRPQLTEEQIAWLRRDMAATRKRWRVVVMHRDVVDYDAMDAPEPADRFTPSGRAFMPVFEELGVDVVLSGHLHIYRRRQPIRQFRPAAQGPLYICCGTSGNDRGYRVPRAPFDAATERAPEEACYLQLIARQDELTLTAYAEDGDKIDSVSLRK